MKNTLFTVIIVISSLLVGLGCTNDPKDNLIDYVERTEAQRDTVLELEEGTVVDVSGTFYFTISAVIAKALPLQFIATTEFVETETGGTLDITLQPLSLDIQQTETPREMVGDPIVLPTIEVDDVGGFEVDLGTVFLVGAANPISGSDIEAELWLKGTIISEDLICGGVKGDIIKPIKAPLDYGNSSFAAKRLADDEEYPTFENMLLGCPSTDEEEGGEAAEEGGEATEEEGGEATEEEGGEATEEEGGEATEEEGGEATEEEGGEATEEEGGEATEEEGGEATEEEGGEASEEGGEATEEGGESSEEGGEGPNGTLKDCSALMECLGECEAKEDGEDEDENCEDNCFDSASPNAQTEFQEFMDCQMEAFGVCGEDEACFQAYCAEEFQTCFSMDGFCMEMMFLEPTVDDDAISGKLNPEKSDDECPSLEGVQGILDDIFGDDEDDEEGPDYCGQPEISGKDDSCTMLFTCDGYEGLDGWSGEMTYFSDQTLAIGVTLNIEEGDQVLSCFYNMEGTWYPDSGTD